MKITGLAPEEEQTARDFVGRLSALGYKPTRSGEGWLAYCPSHEDGTRPALSIREGRDTPLILKCHGGCSFEDVVRAVDGGKRARPISVEQTTRRQALGPVIATYPYADAEGRLLYEVRRHEPKDFRPWRVLPDGSYRPGLGDEARVLYNLPHVLAAAEAGLIVHVVEGEKDAEAILNAGGVATTAFGGAGAPWEPSFTDALRGAQVVIVADRDDADPKTGRYPGQEKALAILEALQDAGIISYIVYPAHGKDAADHIEAGLGLDEWAEFTRPQPVDPNPQLELEAGQVEDDDEPVNPVLAAITLLDLAELLATPPPDPVWTWHGYLERGTLGLLHGDGGLGKSLIGLGLSTGIVRGLPDFIGAPITKGRALYIDAENHPREIRRRIWNFGLRTGLEGLAYGRVEGSILKDDEQCSSALLALIEQTGADFLCLDSQRGLWTGDEREALEVRAFYQRLALVAEKADIGILLLHHDNKGGVYSGSTDQNAAVTSRIHLERKNQGRSIADRRDRTRVLYHEKNRAEVESEPVAFEILVLDGAVEFAIVPEDDDGAGAPPPAPRKLTAADVAEWLRQDGGQWKPGALGRAIPGLNETALLKMKADLLAAGIHYLGRPPHAHYTAYLSSPEGAS